jgi:hypothetical protein
MNDSNSFGLSFKTFLTLGNMIEPIKANKKKQLPNCRVAMIEAG